MKIVCVLGSPRPNGNSATLMQRFSETARELGAEVKEYALNRMNVKGCQACEACKTHTDRCVQKDDMIEVLESVRECDVLVLASPVYYGEVTSQLKTFIDRTYSFIKPDFRTNPQPSRLTGLKKLVMILPQANPNEQMCAGVFDRYRVLFQIGGFAEQHAVRVCGVNAPGDVLQRPEVLQQVEETARRCLG